MVCGDIIDHCEVDGVDLFWIEEYRYVGIVDSEGVKVNMDNAASPAMATELLMGCLQDFSGVEKCFPIDGPRGITDVINQSSSLLLVKCVFN